MARHTHYAVFDLVARNKRILVMGPKGSGKTFLAEKIEKEFKLTIEANKYLVLTNFYLAYTPGAREHIIKDALENNKGYVLVRETDDPIPEEIPFDYVVSIATIRNPGNKPEFFYYSITDCPWKVRS
jgi:hypothetical protein